VTFSMISVPYATGDISSIQYHFQRDDIRFVYKGTENISYLQSKSIIRYKTYICDISLNGDIICDMLNLKSLNSKKRWLDCLQKLNTLGFTL